MKHLIILMHCPDQKGIIASVTELIHANQGNIVYIDQYVDRVNNLFFMRLEIEFHFKTRSMDAFKHDFDQKINQAFQAKSNFYFKNQKPKMGVMVSKYDHCLYDILAQYNTGRLHCEMPLIISNHEDLQTVAQQFNIPYYHIPVSKETKLKAEKNQLKLLKQHKVDFIVLARYMQIVSKEFISNYPFKIINIHHSFLPAFPGAKPYHMAYQRGVKIIGATSHYVTEELDSGPIIEQDVIKVSHLHSVENFIERGQDLERLVLLRALRLHIERKIMVYQNKTIIFN
ncbi:MAG: formyltetrahydrofolate deformylase [Flavobacteriaceae bacterium]|nr:formyltetrahydrofolate deformylase [Flavobacteriaceae bacterium]MCY4254132.1 formyltetrahydrofolate deformylase [Flavobacteriaceae bacterium]